MCLGDYISQRKLNWSAVTNKPKILVAYKFILIRVSLLGSILAVLYVVFISKMLAKGAGPMWGMFGLWEREEKRWGPHDGS